MENNNEDSQQATNAASEAAVQDHGNEPYSANSVAHGGKFGTDQTKNATSENPGEPADNNNC